MHPLSETFNFLVGAPLLGTVHDPQGRLATRWPRLRSGAGENAGFEIPERAGARLRPLQAQGNFMTAITQHMQQDHVEIDRIAERAAAAAEGGAGPEFEREGGEFLRRLQRHIEIEEELLFPAFESRTGMVEAGPSAQMRIEHGQMQPILEAMRCAVAARDGGGYRLAAQALREILVPHNRKEEQVMYPMIDQVLGDEVAALLSEAKAMAR